MTNRTQLSKRVIEAAGSVLFLQQYVRPIDIFVKMGYLQPAHVQDWEKGRTPYLEAAIQCNLGKITFAMKCFRKWTLQRGLVPSETAYLAKTKGEKRNLRFSKSGHPTIEKFYRTHYVSPQLMEKS